MLLLNFEVKTVVLFAVLSIFIMLWIRWRNKKLRIFEELGIPGPPPHFLFGNLLEIDQKGILKCQDEWIKKYGHFVGYFNGLKPVLLIADNDTLKKIFIQDFKLFSARPEVVPLRVKSFLDHIIPATNIMDCLLLNLKGENWKRVRHCLSPTFSINKLKTMIPFVQKLSEVTISILEENACSGKTFDIYQLLQFFTLDVISAQAFAVHTNIQQEGATNKLYRSAKTIFNIPFTSKIIFFGSSFPELSILGMAFSFLNMFFHNGFSIPPLKITNWIGEVIEQRRKNPELRQPDILQHLIDTTHSQTADKSKLKKDTKKEEGDGAINNILNPNKDEISRLKSNQGLSDDEIKANSLVMFLAGYETTSGSLAFAVHMLTKYPEFQTRLQNEIEKFVKDKELDHNTLNNLQLMDRFLMETMRFYPPGVTIVSRVSTQDVDYGYIRIPKGMHITVPVQHMHLRDDIWENPEIFDPDRFLLENRHKNDISNFWSFGIGQRNCIGARLSSLTSKVVLTAILQKFTFEKSKDTEEMNLIIKYGSMVPEKVLVKIRKRTRLPNTKT